VQQSSVENSVRCVLTRKKIVASFTKASVLKHTHLLQGEVVSIRNGDGRYGPSEMPSIETSLVANRRGC
jgi:hypothetical protein